MLKNFSFPLTCCSPVLSIGRAFWRSNTIPVASTSHRKARILNSGGGLLAWLILFLLPVSAQEIGTVTLLEGSLRVIRGTSVFQGAEGVRLHQGDILETSQPAFTQLECDTGPIVALGPTTRVFVLRYAPGHRQTGAPVGSSAEFVLLSGWLKAESSANPGSYRFASPGLAATTKDGTVVLHSGASSSELFVESGSAQVGAVSPNGSVGQGTAAKAGQFFTRRSGKDVENSARPDSAFIEAVPRAFKDTLPSRVARFKGKNVPLKRDHEVSYAEVQPWLTMASGWRRGFVQRFEPRLDDAMFRQALEDHLQEHPEWDPVLHPDKVPASPAAPVHNSDSPTARYGT